MKKHKKIIEIILLLIILIFGIGISEDKKEIEAIECPFFGTWRIEKVAVISDMYTGTTLDGVLEEDLYDSENFLGYELEYAPQYFRIGEERYENPEYVVSYETVHSFDYGGKFWPHIDTFIEEEKIEINNMEDYTSKTMLLMFDVDFSEQVSYRQYSFIPIGTQCVLLNDDTMIVERWGKTLLAHKVKE